MICAGEGDGTCSFKHSFVVNPHQLQSTKMTVSKQIYFAWFSCMTSFTIAILEVDVKVVSCLDDWSCQPKFEKR